MTNAYTFDGLVVFGLLVICTCAYMRRVPRLKQWFLSEKKGFWGVFYKASVIGTRLHFFVSVSCVLAGCYLLFIKWLGKKELLKMLLFCPTCSNILIVEEGLSCFRFACNTCPYVYNIKQKMSNRKYPRLKDVDDVLGGAAAWENVDSTEEKCPKCSHSRAYFMQIQTRSADEPMTTFYKCCSPQCGHQWRDWPLSFLSVSWMKGCMHVAAARFLYAAFCKKISII